MYYGATSGAYVQARGAGIAVGNVTQYTVTALQGGRTYYFTVTAVDSAGNESPYSNEATKLIP
ncbi:fibronectin type III domain-containing protein [Rivibacter subsaxonicus]|uniref:fibronectin type III domain-containing protein n=1 Tax=Rivibacter subsaxonicus TaxID=457575 RepID=UPI003BF8278B